ncbi:hypothetical protein ABT297_40440, partial [Dactylosporangium sp. NPDC000555]
DPAPYLAAVDALGLRAADCVAVEDSALGVASAHAAGCAVLNVAPGLRSELAHAWAPSLERVGVGEIRRALRERDRRGAGFDVVDAQHAAEVVHLV